MSRDDLTKAWREEARFCLDCEQGQHCYGAHMVAVSGQPPGIVACGPCQCDCRNNDDWDNLADGGLVMQSRMSWVAHDSGSDCPTLRTLGGDTALNDDTMRDLVSNATDGPWEDNQDDLTNDWQVVYDQEQRWLIAQIGGGDWNAKNDAAFIAGSREWVPEALDRLDAVREYATALIQVIDHMQASIGYDILKILEGKHQ